MWHSTAFCGFGRDMAAVAPVAAERSCCMREIQIVEEVSCWGRALRLRSLFVFLSAIVPGCTVRAAVSAFAM